MYALPHKTHHVHHPAYFLWLATIILIAFLVLFGFISVFIPWAVKDIAVAQRAWAFPFKTCIQNTFSSVNEETCQDNDFIQPTGVPLTGGSEECKAYILGTIAMVFISVLVGVVVLILVGYILEHLWWSPLLVAFVADILILVVCISANLAWILFIIYMGITCAENSIFPITPNFSYGWIMYLFNSAFAFCAVGTSIAGTLKIRKYQKEEEAESEYQKNVIVTQSRPVYPVVPSSPYGVAMASPAGATVPNAYIVG